MPQGKKDAYTPRQQRMAEHIEARYEEDGVPEDEAERRAWATVNKQTGGGRATKAGRKQADERLQDRAEGRAGHRDESEAARIQHKDG